MDANVIKKRKTFIYKILNESELDDIQILDEDADDWLYNTYKPAPYPLERRNFQLRDREKPKDAYVNNGRKK
jgi:hypothetical protein